MLTVVAGVTPILAAVATRALVDELTRPAGTDSGTLVALGAIVVAAGGLGTVLGYLSSLVAGIQRRAIQFTAENDVHKALTRLRGLRRFEEPDFQNRLGLAMQSGADSPGAVLGSCFELIRSAVMIGGFVGVLVVTWWPASVLLVVAAVPTLAAQRSLARSNASTTETAMALHRRRFSYQTLLTGLASIKEVKLFDLEGLFHDRMMSYSARANAKEIAAERRTALTQSAYVLLTVAVMAVGVVYVIGRAASGGLSAGDVLIFVTAVTSVQTGLGSMARESARAGRAVRLFHHYMAVLACPPDIASGPREPTALRRGIVFEDVWFRYDESGEWVLRGLDLTIRAGESLALVGVNGAGKSTVMKLLCRFYDPDRGRITWDGVDLKELSTSELRRRISAAFQDHTVYDLTVAENIGVGDVARLDDRAGIAAAARMTGADEVARELSDGYDTLVSRIFFQGEGEQPGTALSGGQGQRLALARAMMRDDADLLLLDEPSSWLDALAEQHINRELIERRRGRTSILISHRLSTLREVDRIAVIAHGQVTEIGSHGALMALNGSYAEMFQAQAAAYTEASLKVAGHE
ncbi:ABC transporter ATP-binding protein [Microbispora amethystogenes]|uniref:ABC transporter ATP-binding protein n=1 Tax=Microbispora amethystogenes TaxID=1427754 RepID=UPI003407D014